MKSTDSLIEEHKATYTIRIFFSRVTLLPDVARSSEGTILFRKENTLCEMRKTHELFKTYHVALARTVHSQDSCRLLFAVPDHTVYYVLIITRNTSTKQKATHT